LASLRVVEGALFAVNGVNGVEVQTTRLWERAEALGLCRVLFVTMPDRQRADLFAAHGDLRRGLSARGVPVTEPTRPGRDASSLAGLDEDGEASRIHIATF